MEIPEQLGDPGRFAMESSTQKLVGVDWATLGVCWVAVAEDNRERRG